MAAIDKIELILSITPICVCLYQHLTTNLKTCPENHFFHSLWDQHVIEYISISKVGFYTLLLNKFMVHPRQR